MPDKRSHRGAHPEDVRLFDSRYWPMLRSAVRDLSWLLSKGYGAKSSLKLAGDRYDLNDRQRTAVMRSACSDQALIERRSREVQANDISNRPLLIDGYNVLTTIEASLAGGVILRARDGCLRDMASMHGSYRKVTETGEAIRLIGQCLVDLKVGQSYWLLDSPVSNSGRLKVILYEIAGEFGWNWSVHIVGDPDKLLISAHSCADLISLLPVSGTGRSDQEAASMAAFECSEHDQRGICLVASADSMVLDKCGAWFNLAGTVIGCNPEVQIIDLSGSV